MSEHLVVGAGPVGAATAVLLADGGDVVRLVSRSGAGPDHPGITRIAADASDAPRMADLARGVDAVVNAANPAYHRWASDWPPIAAALLAAAERSGAVLATVSNLYGYGPVDGPMTEDLPLVATGTKGRVRAQMWLDALAAHRDGRVRVVEVRGSDYLCPGPGSQMGDRVVPRVLAGRRVQVLGSADMAHSWTAVQDVARLLAVVVADERAWGTPWHVPSNPPRTQREVVADLGRAAGVAPARVSVVPPAALALMRLVSPLIRELPEVAYQFEHPFVLDSTRTQTTFDLAPTPWQDVIATQVAAYR